MKWIFITLACGALGFMMYSTYSSVNMQLESSALGKKDTKVTSDSKKSTVTVEKIEKTLSDTKNQIKK